MLPTRAVELTVHVPCMPYVYWALVQTVCWLCYRYYMCILHRASFIIQTSLQPALSSPDGAGGSLSASKRANASTLPLTSPIWSLTSAIAAGSCSGGIDRPDEALRTMDGTLPALGLGSSGKD